MTRETWLRWRHSMLLERSEAAAMAGVSEFSVRAFELGGTPRARTLVKLASLVARWPKAKHPRRRAARRGRVSVAVD